MPLVDTLEIPVGRVGLWRIDGTEEARYDLQFPSVGTKGTVHPRTSLQRKASRLLLAQMLGFRPELEKDADGRPMLTNSPLNVSVSHTDGFAAVMLGPGPVSVDVQAITPRILKLRERYLKPEEQRMAPDMDTATLLWAAKETVYKFCATERHDFRAPITVHHISEDTMAATLLVGEELSSLTLGHRWLSGAVLVWLESVRS
ncbi:MAG: 4'-phosphopantetheinyl transferase superfamily protein [Flavobacteriales bacterium]|nr:4'-phosphopantetheinyl transferase superfamily protein [Flavobacteriales bacterium]